MFDLKLLLAAFITSAVVAIVLVIAIVVCQLLVQLLACFLLFLSSQKFPLLLVFAAKVVVKCSDV